MAKCKLIKYFPSPKFLKVPWIGLDMTDESLRIVELVSGSNNSGLKLGRFAEKEIPAGTVESGVIKDRAKLISALKELRKVSPTPYVNASLPEEKSYLFTATVNDGDDDAIRQNIEFILEENVPLKPAETLFEYDVISSGPDKSGKILVSVTAMPSSVADEYNSVFIESGFIPYSMEVEGRPLIRCLLPRGDKRVLLAVTCNERNVGIFLVAGGVIRFTSTTRIDLVDSGDTDFNSTLADFVSNEIDKVHSYWHGKSPSSKIESIIISGKKANDTKFLSELRKRSSTKIEIANVWINVFDPSSDVPEIEHDDSLRYATAIGLALKGR